MSVIDETLMHPQHDELLVAQLAADDVTPSERARAEALVAACAECRLLVDDLRVLTSAVVALPAPMRQRDFRLTESDAARLRGGTVRRWLERLAAPRLAFTQPLGLSLVTLGLAGLVLAGLPGLQGGTAPQALTAVPTQGTEVALPAASPAPVSDQFAAPGAPASSPVRDTRGDSAASGSPAAGSPAAGAPLNPVARAESGPTGSGEAATAPSPPVPASTRSFEAITAPSGPGTVDANGASGAGAAPGAAPPISPAPTAPPSGSGVLWPLALVSGIAVAIGALLVLLRSAGRRAARR